MNANFLFQLYAVGASALIGYLGGFTKHDFYWLIFLIGGLCTVIGHSIFDQKVKFSAGRIAWTIVTSLMACLLIKYLYDEGEISAMTMSISTLISSMVAPAVMSKILKELPTKISENILKVPELLFGALKDKLINTKDNDNE